MRTILASASRASAAPEPQDLNLKQGLLLVGAVLASVPVFIAGLVELVENWATPAYSHGPVIVLLSLWIGLRALRDEPDAIQRLPAAPVWPGFVLILAGLAAGAIGTLGGIGDVSAYGIILWIAGLVAVILGWPRARRLWLPISLLVLMLPLPQFLYWELTTFLQHISAELGVTMIRMMGLSVFLDGNIIDLGIYSLQVAEACAGLQYLFPVISFAVFFAAISRGPLWQRLMLVAFAAPLAVWMNSLRIAITAWIVSRSGIAAAEGFLHMFEGWVILLACILILAAIMIVLRLVTRGFAADGPLFDLDLSGLGPLMGRIVRIRQSWRLFGILVIGAVISALVFLMPAPPSESITRVTFDRFPEQIAEWQGVRRQLDPRIEAVIKADDYLDITYLEAAQDAPVHLFTAYYKDQTNGSALHSPEICLPANGWEVIGIGTRQLDMSGTAYGTFTANRAEIIKGTQRQLVYYWFEQRGSRTANDFAAKFDMIVDGIVRGRRDGAIVRFVTPIKGDDIASAELRIQELMRDALPHLPDFIPF